MDSVRRRDRPHPRDRDGARLGDRMTDRDPHPCRIVAIVVGLALSLVIFVFVLAWLAGVADAKRETERLRRTNDRTEARLLEILAE
jgi:hypothetical protein